MNSILKNLQDPKSFQTYIDEYMKTSTYKAEWKNELKTVEYCAAKVYQANMATYAAAMVGSVVKTAKAVEKADKAATILKIASGSLFQVGDKIAGATISAIASTDGVDTLTVSALDNAVAKDAIVTDYDKTKDVLLGFSYDTLDVRDQEASIAATPTLQVMEVEEDSLPYPINEDIKLGINAVGIALFKIQ